ncbi:hypothetical protein MKX08_003203 [Trichoderma sp. CBMAI-0020]|nr:hypothetical protein MKX08_003203 [Trichoderma sp. CBMAI-0020]
MSPSNENVGSDVDHVDNSSSDVELGTILYPEQTTGFLEVQDMRQGLKSRRLQMLALAGASGTVLGSDRPVAKSPIVIGGEARALGEPANQGLLRQGLLRPPRLGFEQMTVK